MTCDRCEKETIYADEMGECGCHCVECLEPHDGDIEVFHGATA